jgi:hypothetical protein
MKHTAVPHQLSSQSPVNARSVGNGWCLHPKLDSRNLDDEIFVTQVDETT